MPNLVGALQLSYEQILQLYRELGERIRGDAEHFEAAYQKLLAEGAAREQAETEWRLQSEIMANMAEGVALTRVEDAQVVFVNPRFAQMLGYEPHELQGQTVAAINAPAGKSPEETAQEIIACLKRDGVWSGEIPNRRKDGTVVWCDVKISTFEHAQYGTVWVSVHSDITARKQAEAARAESEQHLSLVLEATGRGAWDLHIPTGELRVSPFWISSLGYSAEEFLPHVSFWENLLHPEDRPRVFSALADHLEGRSPLYECVNRLRLKDGSWRWNFDCGRVVEWTALGKPLRMVGTDTNLTGQKWLGLRGIIPICAGCKKIRDQHGHWHQLEKYLGEHTPAQFSHGLCESCVGEFTGETAKSPSKN